MALDADVSEPPAKRAKTGDAATFDDVVREASFFCGQLAPLLGLSTRLVMRLVAKRFAEWDKPAKPCFVVDLVLDIFWQIHQAPTDRARGFARYWIHLTSCGATFWGTKWLQSCTRFPPNIMPARDALPPMRTIWLAVARALRLADSANEAIDMLSTWTRDADYESAIYASLCDAHWIMPYIFERAENTGSRRACQSTLCHLVCSPAVIGWTSGPFFPRSVPSCETKSRRPTSRYGYSTCVWNFVRTKTWAA